MAWKLLCRIIRNAKGRKEIKKEVGRGNRGFFAFPRCELKSCEAPLLRAVEIYPELLSSGRNEHAVKFVPVECFYSNSISGACITYSCAKLALIYLWKIFVVLSSEIFECASGGIFGDVFLQNSRVNKC